MSVQLVPVMAQQQLLKSWGSGVDGVDVAPCQLAHHLGKLCRIHVQAGLFALGVKIVDAVPSGKGGEGLGGGHRDGGAPQVTQVRERAGFDDLALTDNRDAIGENLHLGEDVAGKQDGVPGLLHLANAFLEHRFHEWVEASGRFVQ